MSRNAASRLPTWMGVLTNLTTKAPSVSFYASEFVLSTSRHETNNRLAKQKRAAFTCNCEREILPLGAEMFGERRRCRGVVRLCIACVIREQWKPQRVQPIVVTALYLRLLYCFQERQQQKNQKPSWSSYFLAGRDGLSPQVK